MASVVQSMRLCLRAASRRAATPAATAPRQCLRIQSFSSTRIPCRPAAKKDDVDNLEDEINGLDEAGEAADEIDPAELERLRQNPEFEGARRDYERFLNEMGSKLPEAMRPPRFQHKLFWGEDEPDTDLLVEETKDAEFDEDDIMALAHGKFEEYREYREYARVAAWQMPLLSKLATPFEPPTAREPLRFRYTTYMGEFHPAEKKVVVEFSPRDLPLDEAQQQKLRKLLGPRLNPETDIAKMSCEQFEHQAQNKRYLGDVVNKLVAQAKDPTDMFEDVPLDTRHHTFKVKPKFPKEWRMTEERRQFLEDARQKALLLDQAKEEAGTLVDGTKKIEVFFSAPQPDRQIPVMATSRLSQALSATPSGGRRQPPRMGR
ncbi:mitochondrial ribosomal subunit protein-domain-containing protein [Nemania sp. NC0429]|nr:mitochondrial ribosomal subunit protein-domain-containing protein [Nemania sp. NC0429]